MKTTSMYSPPAMPALTPPIGVGNSVVFTRNFELEQILALPAHRELAHRVQFAQGDALGHRTPRQMAGSIHFNSMCSSNKSGSGLGKRTVLSMDQASS